MATPDSTDGVFVYAKEVISLGLLWHGFHDAIKEADGERILRYWKFLLVVFKSTKHRNYAKEAVNLLYQYYYIFSGRKKMQLLWSRCVNTRGFCGTNIPCDLYMEHLNHRLKSIIRGMGGNLTPERIQHASRSIATVQRVCQEFERQTSGRVHSDHHPYPTFSKDTSSVLQVLNEEEVLKEKPGRKYPSFKFRKSVLNAMSVKSLEKAVKTNLDQLMTV